MTILHWDIINSVLRPREPDTQWHVVASIAALPLLRTSSFPSSSFPSTDNQNHSVQVSPFLERATGDNGQLDFTGFSADLLKLIAEEAEFSYSFATPNSTRPGRLGPIIDVSAGLADATIGPIVPYSTSQKVAFTASYLDTGLVLVTYEGTADGDPLLDPANMIIWMQPFTWSVWGTIVAIIVVYAVIMFYLERDDTASVDFDAPEEQGARGLFKSFWLSSATFIGQLTGRLPLSILLLLASLVSASLAELCRQSNSSWLLAVLQAMYPEA